MKTVFTAVTAALVAATAFAGVARAGDELTITSWGGAYQDSQKKAYFEPYVAAGNKITEAEYNGEVAKIKAMVEAKAITWDVIDVDSATALQGCAEGALEVIDWAAEFDFINSARLRNAAGTNAQDIAVPAPTDLWWTFTKLREVATTCSTFPSPSCASAPSESEKLPPTWRRASRTIRVPIACARPANHTTRLRMISTVPGGGFALCSCTRSRSPLGTPAVPTTGVRIGRLSSPMAETNAYTPSPQSRSAAALRRIPRSQRSSLARTSYAASTTSIGRVRRTAYRVTPRRYRRRPTARRRVSNSWPQARARSCRRRLWMSSSHRERRAGPVRTVVGWRLTWRDSRHTSSSLELWRS